MFSRIRRLFPPVLAALILFLSSQIVLFASKYEVRSVQTKNDQTSHPGEENTSTATLDLPMLAMDIGELKVIAVRPLFAKSRAAFAHAPEIAAPIIIAPKPTVASEPEAPEEPDKPDVLFLGIIGTEIQKSALLKLNKNGKEQWFATDERVEGWNLTTITNQYVVFSLGGREHVVKMNR